MGGLRDSSDFSEIMSIRERSENSVAIIPAGMTKQEAPAVRMFKRRGGVAKNHRPRREIATTEKAIAAIAHKSDAVSESASELSSSEPPSSSSEVYASTTPPAAPSKRQRNNALHQTREFDRELNKDLGSNSGRKLAASNIRSSTTVDYQPDVCKDYKLTGYCGYGDSCKFLHARENYSAGWQLDADYEKMIRSRRSDVKAQITAEDKSSSLQLSREACSICSKDPPETPVCLSCRHLYCEQCFLAHSRKKQECIVCKKRHGGTAIAAAVTTNEEEG